MINEKSEEFSNSQFALKAYMDFKDSNAYMHEAMVLFPANGKSVNGIFKIYPKFTPPKNIIIPYIVHIMH